MSILNFFNKYKKMLFNRLEYQKKILIWNKVNAFVYKYNILHFGSVESGFYPSKILSATITVMIYRVLNLA